MSHDEYSCRQLILESLVEYEDGSMPEPERVRLESHLSHCPPCVVFLKSYRATGRTHNYTQAITNLAQDLHRYLDTPPPATVNQVTALVDQVPGVHFGRILAAPAD